MDLERKTYRIDDLEVKAEDDDSDSPDFKGNLSVAGVLDLGNDIVDPGAFTRTLKQKKGVFPMLIDHDHRNRLGVAKLGEEDKFLRLEGFVNKEKQMSRDTLSDIRFNQRHKTPLGLSIGFNTVKDDFQDGVRHLVEIALWEGSVVTFPMNPKARITSAKCMVSFQDFPIADKSRDWNPEKALRRVRAWAGVDDGLDSLDVQAKYKKCFVWCDVDKPEDSKSYKLLMIDIVDGKAVAVPDAIFSAAGTLQGSDDGAGIPEADAEMAKSHLARYYRKMNLEPPFDASSNFDLELRSIYAYAESQIGTKTEFSDESQALIENTAKALKALVSPEAVDLDAQFKKMHSIYDEMQQAIGLSKQGEQEQAVLDSVGAFLTDSINDMKRE